MESQIERPTSSVRLRRLRLQPLALSVALMVSAGLPRTSMASAQAPMTRAQVETWNRALDDPRFRQLRTLDAAQRRDLADDYGLQQLLPGYNNPTTTRLVTSCNGSGAGSLRDAVAIAVSGDVIDARSLTCAGISIGNGAIVIPQNDLTILGPDKDRFAITTKYANRILTHTGTGTLTIVGVTLRNGSDRPASGPARGGCLSSSGTVALGNPLSVDPTTGVVISGCQAIAVENTFSGGGGIFAAGAVRMTNSVISGNSASGPSNTGGGVSSGGLAMKYSEIRGNTATVDGGATVYEQQGAGVLVASSTVAGNTSTRATSFDDGYAGGLFILGSGDVTLTQATISNNTSSSNGGLQIFALNPLPTVSINNSTITGNTSSTPRFGAGLTVSASTLYLTSTLISGNRAAGNSASDLNSGTSTVLGSNNLVGSHNGVVPPDTLVGVDPRLGPLGNNGGITRTHLLGLGSPAIGAGANPDQVANDQRGSGFPRVLGNAPDIGATEFDPDRIFHNGFD